MRYPGSFSSKSLQSKNAGNGRATAGYEYCSVMRTTRVMQMMLTIDKLFNDRSMSIGPRKVQHILSSCS